MGKTLISKTRLTRAAIAMLVCLGLLVSAGAGADARLQRQSSTPTQFDAATQSHPGACSQNTLSVSQAVGDLNANGVLGQYASLVGVNATGQALMSQMQSTLVVVQVAQTATTTNHGCTTDGLIFGTGQRTLTVGETVGVALPATLRSRLCAAATAGCVRTLLTFDTVFPTNCWNLEQGPVQVAVYLRPLVKAKSRIARPSASVSTACGTGNAGSSTVTLSNGAKATATASFDLNGTNYGPIAAGRSIQVSVPLQTGTSVEIKVTSGGETLVDESVPADPCTTAIPAGTVTTVSTVTTTVPITPVAAPSATAVFSCAAGGVVVTLANGSSATADATFTVNGTAYGPLAPGGTQTVTVPVTQSTSATVTVTSGGRTLLSSVSYTNSCAAGPSATADVECTKVGDGGTLIVALTDGSTATLPAEFTVTVTGNTVAGFGPLSVGPVGIGKTDTLLIPIDASLQSPIVTITSGSQTLISLLFEGCGLNQNV